MPTKTTPATDRDPALISPEESGRLLFDLAHAMRSPLLTILGYAELIETDLAEASRQRAPLKALKRNAHRLESLTDQVANLARLLGPPPPVVLRPLRIADVLQEIIKSLAPYASAAEVHLELRPFSPATDSSPTPRPGRQLDERSLRLCLEALIRNAIEASSPEDTVWVQAKESASALQIEVLDPGPGMTQDAFQGFLEPLARSPEGKRKREGLGLGLTVASRCAQTLGGRIRCVDSEDLDPASGPGKKDTADSTPGCCVVLELP